MRICLTILFTVVMCVNVSASILSEPKARNEIMNAVEFVASEPLYKILLHQKPLIKTLKRMKSIEVLDGLEFLLTTDRTKVALRSILSNRIKRKLLIYYLIKGCDRRYQYNQNRLALFIKALELNAEKIEEHVEKKEWNQFILEITSTV